MNEMNEMFLAIYQIHAVELKEKIGNKMCGSKRTE